MNRKITAVTIVMILLLWMLFPRASENKYYVESIIDYEKGISIHYPKTDNEELNKRISEFINDTISVYEKTTMGESLLSISFDCYSSLWTVIRFKITTEQSMATRSGHYIKTEYKNFFTLSPGSNFVISASFDLTTADSGAGEITPPLENTPLENKKLVALTFDDGPSEHTINIVNTLDSYGVKGTFCVVGTKVSTFRQTIEILHSGGHEIANHTYNHRKLTSLSDDELLEEINETQKAVYNVVGQYPSFLRPTYGAINSRVREQSDMPLLMWSKDTLDWSNRDADAIFRQAISGLKDGDIILFHDIYPSTVEAIKKLIPYLLKNGYYPVTASKLFTLKGMEADKGKAYFSSTSCT